MKKTYNYETVNNKGFKHEYNMDYTLSSDDTYLHVVLDNLKKEMFKNISKFFKFYPEMRQIYTRLLFTSTGLTEDDIQKGSISTKIVQRSELKTSVINMLNNLVERLGGEKYLPDIIDIYQQDIVSYDFKGYLKNIGKETEFTTEKEVIRKGKKVRRTPKKIITVKKFKKQVVKTIEPQEKKMIRKVNQKKIPVKTIIVKEFETQSIKKKQKSS